MNQNKLLYNIKKIASGEGFKPFSLHDEEPSQSVMMKAVNAYNKYAPNFLQNKSKTKAYQLGQTLRSHLWRTEERDRNLEKYRKQGVPESFLRSRIQASEAADMRDKNPNTANVPYYLSALAHDKDFKQGQMDQDRLIAHNKTRRDNIAYQNSWRGKLENAGKSLFNKLRNLGK